MLPLIIPAQTPVPTRTKPHHAGIFVKKKSNPTDPFSTLPKLRVRETQPRLMDQATYDRLNAFFASNYSVGTPSPSAGDKLLGIVGGAASGALVGGGGAAMAAQHECFWKSQR